MLAVAFWSKMFQIQTFQAFLVLYNLPRVHFSSLAILGWQALQVGPSVFTHNLQVCKLVIALFVCCLQAPNCKSQLHIIAFLLCKKSCSSQRSLLLFSFSSAGLESLNADTIGNLEILSNNLLSDISALSGMLGCNTEGQTTIKPANTLVGAVEVLPSNSNGTERCLLSTITQVTISGHPLHLPWIGKAFQDLSTTWCVTISYFIYLVASDCLAKTFLKRCHLLLDSSFEACKSIYVMQVWLDWPFQADKSGPKRYIQ